MQWVLEVKPKWEEAPKQEVRRQRASPEREDKRTVLGGPRLRLGVAFRDELYARQRKRSLQPPQGCATEDGTIHLPGIRVYGKRKQTDVYSDCSWCATFHWTWLNPRSGCVLEQSEMTKVIGEKPLGSTTIPQLGKCQDRIRPNNRHDTDCIVGATLRYVDVKEKNSL
ncbi:hypothetical protein BJV74DRAFT_796001 [Russula compacta]|nr:hypothetical protein BJV74DRAFT_796001 [Russula compacta]